MINSIKGRPLAAAWCLAHGDPGFVEGEIEVDRGCGGQSGRRVTLDAVVVAPRVSARAELLEALGLEPAEVWLDGYLAGTRIEADPSGATAVPGVWVAGNLTDIRAQVITAAAAGLAAGAAINADLALEEARAAASRGRAPAASVPG